MENKINNLTNKLLSDYENNEGRFNGHKVLKVNQIRRNAIKRFAELGFPTKKHEEWRFTPLYFLNQIDFNLQLNAYDDYFDTSEFDNFFFNGFFKNRIVFINGYYSNLLSKIKIKDNNVIIGNLGDAIYNKSEVLLNHLTRYSDYNNDVFVALNTALAQDGAYIYIPDKTNIEEPIAILNITDTKNGAILTQPRNLIVVGNNSNVKIVESNFSVNSNPNFVNSVSEIYVGKNSSLDISKYQNYKQNDYYICNDTVTQDRNSKFNSMTISLAGKFIRNNITSTLKDQNCETNINGLFFMKDNDFVDNHTLIDHATPNSRSDEYYKGILLDSSKAVFNGKIIVRPFAQKTEAYQKNKNLLLSDKATINTKPQLEIFADDVKCSHGATTGFIDNEAIYYLRSRGISEENAKAMMINAFASEIIEKISIPEFRDYVKLKIAERLNVEDIYFCKM